MYELLTTDTNIWVAFSFLIFVIVAYKLGKKSVTKGLDSYISEIREEIDNAERLRVEAQELLAQYQRKQRDADAEVGRIEQHAQSRAEQIRTQMEADIDEAAARRKEQLNDRMSRMEQNAVQEIREHTANLIVEAAEELIRTRLDESQNRQINMDAIQRLEQGVR